MAPTAPLLARWRRSERDAPIKLSMKSVGREGRVQIGVGFVEYLSQLKLMNACEVFITKHTGKCHVSILYILYQ